MRITSAIAAIALLFFLVAGGLAVAAVMDIQADATGLTGGVATLMSSVTPIVVILLGALSVGTVIVFVALALRGWR